MNKTKLKELRFLQKEIEMLQKQIQTTTPEMITDSVKGSSVDFPYTYNSIKICGIDEKSYNRSINRLKNKLKRRVEELMDLVDEIYEYIDNIESSEIRQILSLRYINNLTWQQIAFHLGYADESVPRKRIDRHIE